MPAGLDIAIEKTPTEWNQQTPREWLAHLWYGRDERDVSRYKSKPPDALFLHEPSTA